MLALSHAEDCHSAWLIFSGGGKDGWSKDAVCTVNCIGILQGQRARIPLAKSIRIIQPYFLGGEMPPTGFIPPPS